MTAALKAWKVLPHGQLTTVDDNILTVTGQIRMPIAEFPRRMTVVRLLDGRLVIFSAISLDETEMRKLEDFGEPAYLIVPNNHHRMDAASWKDRYPDIRVIVPEGARSKIEKAVPVNATTADFGDPNIVLITVPGTRAQELAMRVDGAGGTTLIINDLIGNIHGESGFGGWMLRMMGFAGDEPHIPFPIRMSIIGDKKALRAQLLEWAALPSLRRILVSHGETIEGDPGGVLRKLADALN